MAPKRNFDERSKNTKKTRLRRKQRQNVQIRNRLQQILLQEMQKNRVKIILNVFLYLIIYIKKGIFYTNLEK